MHLAAACDASRQALGVERIALYQLHAPDPRTPLATSVRALAGLKQAGLIERIGLCNVSRGQIEHAGQIAPIDAVQIELSVFRDRDILSGVVRYCIDHGIQLIAHRPLGGVRKQRAIERDPLLAELASRHGVTPQDIALAWLLDVAEIVVPIPGPTRVETASRVGQAYRIQLTDDDRAVLQQRVPAGAKVRSSAAAIAAPVTSPSAGEIVLSWASRRRARARSRRPSSIAATRVSTGMNLADR
jgi:aryl-alcohol dehydrogenase-like predicted oxidoreductase